MEYNSFYGGRRGASFIIAKSFRLINEEKLSLYEKYIEEEIQDTEKYPGGRPDWIKQNVMAVAFRQGGAYTVVNYDEYVIIDTYNKNDIDNGKVYRRGYNYANDPNNLGGAEYIGQIVGPAGLGPHLELDEISDVHQKYINAEESGDQLDYRHDTGTLDIPTADLVPGAKGTVNNRTFDDDTDKIHWEYFSLRDDQQLETTCYVGFKTPYLVVDYSTEAVEPYNQAGHYADMSAITRLDDQTHPFYEQWKLSIPKGIQGDTLKNFKLYTPNSTIKMKDIDGTDHNLAAGKTVLVYDYIHYDNEKAGESTTVYLGEYDIIDDISLAADGTITVVYKGNKQDDVFNKALKYITQVTLTPAGLFTVTYNNDREIGGQGQTYTTTLTWVTGIAVNSDGSVTTTYNNGSPTTTGRDLQWVENIRIDNTDSENNGKIYRKYSNADNEVEIAQMKYVDNIDMSADGTITYTYNNNETKVDENQIIYVKDIDIAADGTITSTNNADKTEVLDKLTYVKNIDLSNEGVITYTYNDDTTSIDDTQMKYINDITIANNGTVTYKNNANETVKTQANRIRWVTGSTYNANAGTISFSYNYGPADTYTYKYIATVDLSNAGVFTVTDNTGANMLTKTIEYPTKVELIDGYKLQITANTGTILLQENLKWVEDIDIYEDKFRLHYNDSTTSTIDNLVLNQIDEMAIPTTGAYIYHLLIYYTAESKRGLITYNGKTGWTDLGVIKDYNGILVGTNISKSTDPSLDTIAGCLTYLNTTYPSGIVSGYAAGKVVTIGEDEADKWFFAYDYANNEWIYLGSIVASTIYPSCIVGDASVAERAANLPSGSLWFVVEGV